MRTTITIPVSDYKKLIEMAEDSADFVRCEHCGAWMTMDEDAMSTVDGVWMCWAAALDDDSQPCVKYRVVEEESE